MTNQASITDRVIYGIATVLRAYAMRYNMSPQALVAGCRAAVRELDASEDIYRAKDAGIEAMRAFR